VLLAGEYDVICSEILILTEAIAKAIVICIKIKIKNIKHIY
jgi:hypothetical protein